MLINDVAFLHVDINTNCSASLPAAFWPTDHRRPEIARPSSFLSLLTSASLLSHLSLSQSAPINSLRAVNKTDSTQRASASDTGRSKQERTKIHHRSSSSSSSSISLFSSPSSSLRAVHPSCPLTDRNRLMESRRALLGDDHWTHTYCTHTRKHTLTVAGAHMHTQIHTFPPTHTDIYICMHTHIQSRVLL